MSRFLDQLRDRVLFFDGGMGTQVQAREPVSYTHLTLPTNREV